MVGLRCEKLGEILWVVVAISLLSVLAPAFFSLGRFQSAHLASLGHSKNDQGYLTLCEGGTALEGFVSTVLVSHMGKLRVPRGFLPALLTVPSHFVVLISVLGEDQCDQKSWG